MPYAGATVALFNTRRVPGTPESAALDQVADGPDGTYRFAGLQVPDDQPASFVVAVYANPTAGPNPSRLRAGRQSQPSTDVVVPTFQITDRLVTEPGTVTQVFALEPEIRRRPRPDRGLPHPSHQRRCRPPAHLSRRRRHPGSSSPRPRSRTGVAGSRRMGRRRPRVPVPDAFPAGRHASPSALHLRSAEPRPTPTAWRPACWPPSPSSCPRLDRLSLAITRPRSEPVAAPGSSWTSTGASTDASRRRRLTARASTSHTASTPPT